MSGKEQTMGLESLSDEDLLRLAASGDEAAFGIFCSRALPELLNAMRYECKVYGAPEDFAEDAVQSALLKSIKYIRTNKPSSVSRGLISVIARRSLLRLIRSEGRLFGRYSLRSSRAESVEEAADPMRASVTRALIIREAFDLLPPMDRDILRLVLIEGKSREEVAHKTGVNITNIRKRYYRAILKMRILLEDLPHDID
jgi:RNA polymerase sigma factor (sigma-70 family)